MQIDLDNALFLISCLISIGYIVWCSSRSFFSFNVAYITHKILTPRSSLKTSTNKEQSQVPIYTNSEQVYRTQYSYSLHPQIHFWTLNELFCPNHIGACAQSIERRRSGAVYCRGTTALSEAFQYDSLIVHERQGAHRPHVCGWTLP